MDCVAGILLILLLGNATTNTRIVLQSFDGLPELMLCFASVPTSVRLPFEGFPQLTLCFAPVTVFGGSVTVFGSAFQPELMLCFDSVAVFDGLAFSSCCPRLLRDDKNGYYYATCMFL